jgi:single-strand DNA-binding protein
MSASWNHYEIGGHLGDDPESREAGGSTLTRLRVCTVRKWHDKKSGKTEEEKTWHNVCCWGPLAVTTKKYLRKGRFVRCVGRLRSSKYTDRDGVERLAFELVAHTVDFLDTKGAARPNDERSDRDANREWA